MGDVECRLDTHGCVLNQCVGNSATHNGVEGEGARHATAAAGDADDWKTSQQHTEPALVNFKCGSRDADIESGDLIIQNTFDIKFA